MTAEVITGDFGQQLSPNGVPVLTSSQEASAVILQFPRRRPELLTDSAPSLQDLDDGLSIAQQILQPTPREVSAEPEAAKAVISFTPFEVVYSNGVKHLYHLDENGKKRHISYDQILTDYGYTGKSARQGKPTTKHFEATEADSQLPSRDLSDEQWRQFEAAVQTQDRSKLPVPLSDQEWVAALGKTGPDTEAVLGTEGVEQVWQSQAITAVDLPPLPPRNRLKDAWLTVQDTYGDLREDKGYRRRFIAKSVAVFAITAAGAGFIANTLHADAAQERRAVAVSQPAAQAVAPQADSAAAQPAAPAAETSAAAEAAKPFVLPHTTQPTPTTITPDAHTTTVTVRQGDILWNLAEKELKNAGLKDPSVGDINAQTRKIARDNHIDLRKNADKNLRVGTKLKLTLKRTFWR